IQRRMGLEVPSFKITSAVEAGKGLPYGLAQTSSELDQAILLLLDSFGPLLELSEVEKAVELMAAEIEKTRRRVNALEFVLIPQLEETIRFITMKLEENERSTLTRLMKVKDIVRGRDL
ncbi:MAG TPA: V-type ATP synthase subunit D, partial [Firmicutes bacterium]|nr:V-type ATP synthase subunit D [Bacillota bacterium]